MDCDKFKSPAMTKRWPFDFYFLLLASYNNVYYKYESFFIFFLLNEIRKHCHNKRYWIYVLCCAKMDSVVCFCPIIENFENFHFHLHILAW
jgi:hypothetical protein